MPTWRNLCAKCWQYLYKQCLTCYFRLQSMEWCFLLEALEEGLAPHFLSNVALREMQLEKKLAQIIFKVESFTNHSLFHFFPKTVGHFLLWNPHFAPSRDRAEHLQCVFACLCVSTCSLTRLRRGIMGGLLFISGHQVLYLLSRLQWLLVNWGYLAVCDQSMTEVGYKVPYRQESRQTCMLCLEENHEILLSLPYSICVMSVACIACFMVLGRSSPWKLYL